MIHIPFDIDTARPGLRVAVAHAGLKLGCSLLPLQDGDGVVAPPGAPFSGEHGPAVSEVEVQSGAAEVVGAADPLGHLTGDHSAVLVGVLDLRPAGSQAALRGPAELVLAAVTLGDREDSSQTGYRGGYGDCGLV